ncbi:MAG TPA: MBL fold metallo-hydrolase RNA specificity domain-containing protein, partial [Acidobacteriota bacterium]|nr:MBL fold metallo-hydrolase RNA specificity domain-containing protein [Acidobacteriota bacterium]
LEKYSSAAKEVGISNLINEVELVPFRNQVKRRLKILQHEDRSKYIVVMTGHQGEKQAVLANMLNGELPNVFNRGDVFIFSCNVIPTAAIEEARMAVEEKLELKGVRLFKDVHVSGHASKEDLRDLIKATKPEHVIPSHGTLGMMKAYAEIAQAEGYIKDKTLHFLDVGNEVQIPK